MKKESASEKRTPPYLPFKTFLTALSSLKGKPAPHRIDRSFFKEATGLSGSSISALLPALDFLGLTENYAPTAAFHAFVDGSEEAQKTELSKILKDKFPDAMKILPTATMGHFNQGFGYQVGDSVKQRCVAFFISAAKFSGLPMSSYISEGSKVRRERRKPGAGPKAADKVKEVEAQAQDFGDNKKKLEIAGLVTMPVPVGLNKTWYVAIEEGYTDDDIVKFTNMIELSLLKLPKKGRI